MWNIEAFLFCYERLWVRWRRPVCLRKISFCTPPVFSGTSVSSPSLPPYLSAHPVEVKLNMYDGKRSPSAPYCHTSWLGLKLFNLTWLNVGAFRSWNMILFLRSSSTSYEANECPYGRQFASSDQEESNQTVKKKLTKDVPDLVITKVNIDSNYGISFPVLI